MIRVAVIDDHPALRAGLRTVLDLEPGIVFAGESDGSSSPTGSSRPSRHRR
jgi:DNA-binding NarL/FixJ family response regulator